MFKLWYENRIVGTICENVLEQNKYGKERRALYCLYAYFNGEWLCGPQQLKNHGYMKKFKLSCLACKQTIMEWPSTSPMRWIKKVYFTCKTLSQHLRTPHKKWSKKIWLESACTLKNQYEE